MAWHHGSNFILAFPFGPFLSFSFSCVSQNTNEKNGLSSSSLFFAFFFLSQIRFVPQNNHSALADMHLQTSEHARQL
jgi:hypothetical protein